MKDELAAARGARRRWLGVAVRHCSVLASLGLLAAGTAARAQGAKPAGAPAPAAPVLLVVGDSLSA